MMPKVKLSRVNIKAYKLTDAYENRKCLFTECIYVNDVNFSELV